MIIVDSVFIEKLADGSKKEIGFMLLPIEALPNVGDNITLDGIAYTVEDKQTNLITPELPSTVVTPGVGYIVSRQSKT